MIVMIYMKSRSVVTPRVLQVRATEMKQIRRTNVQGPIDRLAVNKVSAEYILEYSLSHATYISCSSSISTS